MCGGKDVFVNLPTGSGKSNCILPYVFDKLKGRHGRSIAVVVSPLISLIKDRVQMMNAKGIRAVYIGDCTEDGREAMEVCSGKYQLVISAQKHIYVN